MHGYISPAHVVDFRRICFMEARRKKYISRLSVLYADASEKLGSIFSINTPGYLYENWQQDSLEKVIDERDTADFLDALYLDISISEKCTINDILTLLGKKNDRLMKTLRETAIESGKLVASSYNPTYLKGVRGLYEILQEIYISRHNLFVLKKYSETDLRLERTTCLFDDMTICDLNISWLRGFVHALDENIHLSIEHCLKDSGRNCEFRFSMEDE